MLIHNENEYTWQCNCELKKSPEMNMVDITQIISINRQKK